MEVKSSVSGGTVVSMRSEQRDGHCPDCNGILNEPTAEEKAEWKKTRLLKRLCPACGERKLGKLVCRYFSIEPPKITCLKLSCLWRYPVKALTYALLMHWDKYRILYCKANRHNDIPEYLKTGEQMPTTLFGTILGIIKLAKGASNGS